MSEKIKCIECKREVFKRDTIEYNKIQYCVRCYNKLTLGIGQHEIREVKLRSGKTLKTNGEVV